MSKYVYGGASGNVGRFRYIKTGAVLELTADEAEHVKGSTDFFPLPVRGQKELHVTGNTTLTADDSGKKVMVSHSANATITLPADPVPGCRFEIYHYGDPTKDITVDLNGKDLDPATAKVATAAIQTA